MPLRPKLLPSLLCILFLLLISFTIQAQEEDKSLSYLASGSASAKFSWEGFTMTMDGTHQEIGFWQDRSPFTNLFTGLNLISQDYSGEDTDGSGNRHLLDYSNQSLFYTLGYDWYLASFAHLQPFGAYGIGVSTHQATYTASDGTVTAYEEKSETADMGIIGVNLILELTGKLWLGYAYNYFIENQTIKYHYTDATIEPGTSQTVMLVWSWERVPIKSIDPSKNFFGF